MPAENISNPNHTTNLLFQLGKVCSHMKDVIANRGGLLLTKEPFPDIAFHDGVVLGGCHHEMEERVADTTKHWLEGAIKQIVKYIKHELQDNELNGYFNTIEQNVLQDTFRSSTKHNASFSLIPINSNTKASIFLQIILFSCISEKCNHEIIAALNGYDKKNTFKQKECSAKTEYGRLQEMWCFGLSISIKYAVHYSCRLNANGRLNRLLKLKKHWNNNSEQVVAKIFKPRSTLKLLPALFMENIITKSAYLFGFLGPNAVMVDCFTLDPKHKASIQYMRMTSKVEQVSDLDMTNVAAVTYVNYAQFVLHKRVLSLIEQQQIEQVKKPKVPKRKSATVWCDILSFFIVTNKETSKAIETLNNIRCTEDCQRGLTSDAVDALLTFMGSSHMTSSCHATTVPSSSDKTNDNSITIHSNLINTGSPGPSHHDGIDFEENSTPAVVPATNDNSITIHSNLINTGSPGPSHHDGIDFEENSTPAVVPATNDHSNQLKTKLHELIEQLPKFKDDKDYSGIENEVKRFVVERYGEAAANNPQRNLPLGMTMLTIIANDLKKKEESEWPEVLGNFFVDTLHKSMEKKGNELLKSVTECLLDTALMDNMEFFLTLLTQLRQNQMKVPNKGEEIWKWLEKLQQEKVGDSASATNKRKLDKLDRDNSKLHKKLSKTESSLNKKQSSKLGTKNKEATTTQPWQDNTPKSRPQKKTTQKARGSAPHRSRSQNHPMTDSSSKMKPTNSQIQKGQAGPRTSRRLKKLSAT
jgi:uncharacterized protein (DUF2132 family)